MELSDSGLDILVIEGEEWIVLADLGNMPQENTSTVNACVVQLRCEVVTGGAGERDVIGLGVFVGRVADNGDAVWMWVEDWERVGNGLAFGDDGWIGSFAHLDLVNSCSIATRT